jgi:hypothetical protein
MKRALVCLLVVVPAGAGAWEADTTHVGLTEQAALASGVHVRLQNALGRRLGWLEALTVAPAAFAELYKRLELLPPAGGTRPDSRGRQTAIAWLRAGALLEGIPAARNRNHFYDPVHKTGLTGKNAGGLGEFAWETIAGDSLPGQGMAAPDWVAAKDNELGLDRFWIELERAATAPLPADRDQHLALALMCAGGVVHVLEDVGFPANARDDLKEYLSPLGGGPADRGSRLARLAAYIYGSLGVPAPGKTEKREKWRAFFTAEDGTGLADVTASRWYSLGTLPGEVRKVGDDARPADVLSRVKEAQSFPSPAPRELNLKRAATDAGATLRQGGVCLAAYRLRDERLSFSIPDDCAAEQLSAILPTVGSYATGLLEWMFRGQLEVTVRGGTAIVTGPGLHLGKGTLRVLVEDAQGARRQASETAASAGAEELGKVTLPAGGAKVVAVFVGTDAAGEPIVAVGERELGR